MKLIIAALASFACLTARAEGPAPVLTEVEGAVTVLAPLAGKNPKDAIVEKVNGKWFEVLQGTPGMPIPNGAMLRTLGDGKAKVVLGGGDSFTTGNATKLLMNWKPQLGGKTVLDLDLKDGVVHGVVKKRADLAVNIATKSFKAAVPGADFITGKLESLGIKDPVGGAVSGSVMKVLSGVSSILPFGGKKSDAVEAKAGSDVVAGAKSASAIPFLNGDLMKSVTALNPAKLLPIPGPLKGLLGFLTKSSDETESEVASQPAPPKEDCGCPSLVDRMKLAVLEKTGLSGPLADASPGPVPSGSPQQEEALPVAQASSNPTPEGSVLDKASPMSKQLACMSPVLTDLQGGAAQIVNILKGGLFQSKEAKTGDCVSNNSVFKNLGDARSKLKFPNGDELISGDKSDMLMKWTKDKLNLKLDQGTLRATLNKLSGRTVDMQSGSLKALTKGGDFSLSAPKMPSVPSLPGAPPPPQAMMASAALGAAPGLFGATFSIFGGLAKIAGKTISPGEKVVEGHPKPIKMTPEEMDELNAQTSLDPRATRQALQQARKNKSSTDKDAAGMLKTAEKSGEKTASAVATGSGAALNGVEHSVPNHPAPQLDHGKASTSNPEEDAFRQYIDPQ